MQLSHTVLLVLVSLLSLHRGTGGSKWWTAILTLVCHSILLHLHALHLVIVLLLELLHSILFILGLHKLRFTSIKTLHHASVFQIRFRLAVVFEPEGLYKTQE